MSVKGVINKMKLTCPRENLLQSINTVLKAVSGRTTLPILECILLNADENGFDLTSNDLELGIKSVVKDSNIDEYGSIAIEAKIFSEIIRKLDGEEVFITSDENNKVSIKCASSKFNLIGQSSDDFPLPPSVEKNDTYTMSQNLLKEMIKQTIFSISLDDSRPVLTGEFLEIKNGFVSLVSVDGYRISFKKSVISDETKGVCAIIPGKTLNEISKILSSEDEDEVSIFITDKHILFDLGESTVVSRLIEGEYIKYEQSFSDDYKTKIILSRLEFIASLERASLMSRDMKKIPVKIEISQNKMIITSNTEMGTAYEEIIIESEGDELVIAFNPKYLIDALKVINDEKVSVQFTTSLSPCIIKPIDKNDYKYLILPLRM